jgi:hypothetical protein
VSEWQPIETAPKDGTTVLLWQPAKVSAWCKEGGYLHLSRWYVHYENGAPSKYREPEWYQNDMSGGFGGYCGPLTPTHWMPMPPPPALG